MLLTVGGGSRTYRIAAIVTASGEVRESGRLVMRLERLMMKRMDGSLKRWKTRWVTRIH